MATATVPRTTPQPIIGKNANVHVTPGFRDDLAVLMRNGRSLTTVVRAAVRLMADAYRLAWDYGDVPPAIDPPVTHAVYAGEILPCGHTVGGSGA